MPTFRKKPVFIEAEQYHKGAPPVRGLCTDPGCGYVSMVHVHPIHEGQAVILQDGDWIIPEPDGIHFYPCKPEIFKATYEAV